MSRVIVFSTPTQDLPVVYELQVILGKINMALQLDEDMWHMKTRWHIFTNKDSDLLLIKMCVRHQVPLSQMATTGQKTASIRHCICLQ